MASSLGIAPLLKTNEVSNEKWIDRDPLDLIKGDCLQQWYNELLEEKELYIRPESYINRLGVIAHKGSNGHYYCGQTVLECQCCNGVCGPTFGCNCSSCQELEIEIKENDGRRRAIFSTMESWSWGNLPSKIELRSFAKRVAHKQLDLFKESTNSLQFIQRIKARVYVYAKFLALASRNCFKTQKNDNDSNETIVTSPITLQGNGSLCHTVVTETDLTSSGLNLFIKYTFKFLESSWQHGVNVELCSEILSESVELFGNINKVLLCEESPNSNVVISMINKLIPTLEDLVKRDVTTIPIKDRKMMLQLLFELAFQNASLASFLRVIVTALKLEQNGVLDFAPLSTFVKKLYLCSQQLDCEPEIVNFYCKGSTEETLSSETELSMFNQLDECQEERLSTTVSRIMKVLMFFLKPYQTNEKKNLKKCSNDILVWGNLKLLSSLKEEKSPLKIATICCTEAFVVVLSLTGKLFTCEHNNETMSLKPYSHVASMNIIQVACSYGGHFIVLTKEKEVFTWKDQNNAFNHLSVVHLHIKTEPAIVFVGYSYYAVITKQQELCIWENSLSGRPTHDNHHLQFFPRCYPEFIDDPVVDVAFSQYHAEVILVSKQGKIWSWLDEKVSLLSDETLDIVKVYIAKYFYVALSSKGQVWRWGRDRFSKVKSKNMVCLQSVEKLNKQNVLTISVGAYHCIALTDSYNVFCWGGLGGKEEDESLIREPVLLKAVSELGVTNITAGPHQIFCWTAVLTKKLEKKVPFCVDVKEETFEVLQTLLSLSCDKQEEKNDVLIPCLTLLKLQFEAAKILDIPAKDIGFNGTKDFSIELKNLVIGLVLDDSTAVEIKRQAEEILQCGWQYILPTADERAKTLSQFLKLKGALCEKSNTFMLNLLMDCLTQKNGLDVVLEETIDIMLASKKPNLVDTDSCTLYVLLKELFLITVSSCYMLHEDKNAISGLNASTLKLLLWFQRLLFARIFIVTDKDLCWPARCYVYEPTPTVKHLTSIVNFYMALLQTSCKQILTWDFKKDFSADVMIFSPIGILLQEFLSFMIILQNYAPVVVNNCDGLPQLSELLDAFDNLNENICSMSVFANDDLAWSHSKDPSKEGIDELEEKTSSSNKNKLPDDEGKEEDSSVQLDTITENLFKLEDSVENFVGKEIASVFDKVFKTDEGKEIVKTATYTKDGKVFHRERVRSKDIDFKIQTLYTEEHFFRIIYDIQVSIGFLLGLHCCYLSHGMYPTQDELNYKTWLSSTLFSSGVNRDAVLKDKKAEFRFGNESLEYTLNDLMEQESSEKVNVVLTYLWKLVQKKGIQIIPAMKQGNVWLEQTTKCIFASMICHCGLDQELMSINSYTNQSNTEKHIDQLPEVISDVMFNAIKLTMKERTALFQKHQETQKSYAELCEPIIKRCRFLCHCLIPSCNSQLQQPINRWYDVITKVKMAHNYNWNISQWGIKRYHKNHLDVDERLIVLKEICQFVKEDMVNTDIVKKCFLIQIKRTKQRLISGYLLQSLCLRQQLLPSVKYSLLCGWLGMLVPGGSVCHPKPGILFNVPLVPKDDVIKLKDVFHGFESFALKIIFDELETILLRMETEPMAILKNAIRFSARSVLMNFTILTSSLMSGDIDFVLQCTMLSKLQMLLKRYSEITTKTTTTTTKQNKQLPFIDERKHKQRHLQEMKGEDMVKIMKIGTRVTRGLDWKWDDQVFCDGPREKKDGPSPHLGSIVSEVADDGWVRVEWDTGSRNSYRMGKSGKYDLKIVDSDVRGRIDANETADELDCHAEREEEEDDDDDEKDLNECDHGTKHDVEENSPLPYLMKTVTSMLLYSLSMLGSQDEAFTPSSMDVLSNFIINTLRYLVDTNLPNCGPHVSIPGTFGIIRAVMNSKQLQKLLPNDIWIKLLVQMLNLSLVKDNTDTNAANALYVKVQLVRHIEMLLHSQNKHSYEAHWKRWFVRSMFKLLTRGISNYSLYIPDLSSSTKATLTASEHTTICEEIITLLRRLHTKPEWCDMINLIVWKSLSILSKDTDASATDKVKLLSAFSIISSIDSRVRIGGCATSQTYGCGTISKILPDGKISLFYGRDTKSKSCHLSKLNLIPVEDFDMDAHLSYHRGIRIYLKMVDIVMEEWKQGLDGFDDEDSQMDIRLYVGALRCLSEACKNHDLIREMCHQLTCNEKQKFYKILSTSLLSCPVKSIYDQEELQMASVCIIQDIATETKELERQNEHEELFSMKSKVKVPYQDEKGSDAALQSSNNDNDREAGTKTADRPFSSHLVQLLTAMGFPTDYIEVAMKELGENSRPEQIVSWLLENPNYQKRENVKHSPVPDERPLVTTFENNKTPRESDDVYLKVFSIGSLVKCVIECGEIATSDVGTVLKILTETKNVLVFWENLKKSLWVCMENLEITNGFLNSADHKEYTIGKQVKLKDNTNLVDNNPNLFHGDVGIIQQVHRNGRDVTVMFDENNRLWEGSIKDLILIKDDIIKNCSNCKKELVENNMTIACEQCTDLEFCEECFASSAHEHELTLGEKKDVSLINSSQSCVKEVRVSSNEHIAARMFNQELDMPWISDESSQPHFIKVKLQPNTIVTSIYVSLDTLQPAMYPSQFQLYAGNSKKKGKTLLNTVVLKQTDTTIVKLLGELDQVYSYIEIQIFVNNEKTPDINPPCLISYLKIDGKKQNEGYDEQITSLIYCQDKVDSMKVKMDQIKKSGFLEQKVVKKQVKVFCWGLNDKDQLGGIKGSKIKFPSFSETLSPLNCCDFAGGSKTLFCLTRDGKVYACGESSSSRLGLGSQIEGNVTVPTLIEGLSHVSVKKLAVHSGGRHVLALTTTGEVYSWGDGDDGKLGHGDKIWYDQPRVIESLLGKNVTNIACGSAHSAAIVDNKDLYTWGLGDYGRLGHGDEVVQLKPKWVKGLLGYNVVDVSLGSRDAQTVCLTDDGNVWSWGDGDFGKLGRGGSDGCLVPVIIEKLRGEGVKRILCGAQFTLALTNSGTLWTWGKGDFFRLGHNSDAHVREPKCIDFLSSKRIIDVAVGALHCLAVTEDGEVYAWGDNDHGQQGTGTTTGNRVPSRILGIEEQRIKRVACGSSHSIAWTEINPTTTILEEPVAFPINRDPLGAHAIIQKDNEILLDDNLAKFMKEQRPSLIRTTLQIVSKDLKYEVLQNMKRALQIKFSRTMLVECLKCFLEDDSFTFPASSSVLDNLSSDHIKDLVKLLKLGIYGHLSKDQTEIIESFLSRCCKNKPQVSDVLVDVCLTELEEKLAYNTVLQDMYKQCIQESSHPYIGAPGVKLSGSVEYPGAVMLVVEFSPECQTEPILDVLTFYDGKDRMLAMRTGSNPSDWNTKLRITGGEMRWVFATTSTGGLWGFRFTVTPIPPSDDVDTDCLADDTLLQQPCLELIRRLFACDIISGIRNETTILNLSSLLSMCIRTSMITAYEKKWLLDYLHLLLLSHNAPPIDVPAIMGCGRFRDLNVCKLRLGGNQALKDVVLQSSLARFINGVPQALAKQYEFEEPLIRRGEQLMFSPFLRSLALFACSLGVDTLPCCSNRHQWAWFIKYCMAIRTAQSLIQNTKLPTNFAFDVREKIEEVLNENEVICYEHEDNDLFSKTKDEQLLMWLNTRAQDWSVIWGGSGTVYGWGHNHRGQLGGIEGAKIKAPTVCDALAALKPIQMAGGEQTLFCVTFDGKVYATGYGNGSRLGLGIVETISTPRMLESLQHINIKKIAVHSGGRHCLALSSDGEVFSWGEGDDGKLGHGNRNSCSHPKLIESFIGKNIVDIACGGSHSAAIGPLGELYTWGKGRYGRLGHGDGEDQLRPKMVEALQHHRVIDVACGSGDAQTLCITSDYTVWSWGDGDYGKLGRGGSDGCKTPLIIEDLNGKNVIKVECGSQFSMAFTRQGALYTWGKGDYFRLGHGSEEHVRRPRRVMALENKNITSICCGSLHCVVCTDDGEVYSWGDNDEGQLGDGTTNAGQLPKLCNTIQNKKIDCIACGSAHTIAWSTCQSSGHTLPDEIPMEYNQLQDVAIPILRNRALLLHCFSKLFCSCVSLMELANDVSLHVLTGDLMVNSLKKILLSSYKENTFRKMIDVTMIRDRQHGPVIELNRVKKHRVNRGLAGPNGSKSVFGQITSKISEFSAESFCLPHRTWKVKFIGESVDDCGGGFSESIAEMCDELQNGALPLLLPTPNSCEDNADTADCFIINPDAKEETHQKLFRFLGILLGIAIRSGSPLSLSLAESVWKQLVGLPLTIDDIDDIDRGFVAKHSYLTSLTSSNIIERNAEEKVDTSLKDCTVIEDLDLSFSVRTSSSRDVKLSSNHNQVTSVNKTEYLKSALNYRLHEFDQQVHWIRSGMAQVIPVPLLSLFTGAELENMICGSPEIHVESLRSITTYRGIEPSSLLVKWFWQALEEFTNHERSLFLRFVWGRTRLPRTAVDFKGKDFIFQVLDKYHPADKYLPESYTCFFMLKMPRYSNANILKEKLKYAIYFCKSIDSDDYARIDLVNT